MVLESGKSNQGWTGEQVSRWIVLHAGLGLTQFVVDHARARLGWWLVGLCCTLGWVGCVALRLLGWVGCVALGVLGAWVDGFGWWLVGFA